MDKKQWSSLDRNATGQENKAARNNTRGGGRRRVFYLSANFERGSQLSVLVGMFRLDFKPAILLGLRGNNEFLGEEDKQKPDEVWFVCGARQDH